MQCQYNSQKPSKLGGKLGEHSYSSPRRTAVEGKYDQQAMT